GSGESKPPPILWDKHPEYTQACIAYLSANPKFRIKIFSDSTSEAKKQKRQRVQSHTAKSIMFAELAEAVF
ncbi:hypothetical protein PUNSTDRAFT_22244, partial [Punctularia strigosozonata HHB-11173 SS5]|uniref:uncharacterized protein n=1 Tax=Punctularia strigosozonata (strain HHB-11173) TaxID=741275 RepID=UPI0004418030